jgi:hypothetical protein
MGGPGIDEVINRYENLDNPNFRALINEYP